MGKRLFDEKHRCFTKRIRADTSSINVEARTIPVIMVSDDNGGLRYDWRTGKYFIEELDPNGADMSELNSIFKDHNPSTDTVLGRVINKRIEDGKNKADAVFGSKPEAQTVFLDYQEGNLTDFSIGYDYDDADIEVTDRKVDGVPVWVIRKYQILELSTVWKGFDKGAKVGRGSDDSRGVVITTTTTVWADDDEQEVDEPNDDNLDELTEDDAIQSEIRQRELNLKEKEAQI